MGYDSGMDAFDPAFLIRQPYGTTMIRADFDPPRAPTCGFRWMKPHGADRLGDHRCYEASGHDASIRHACSCGCTTP